MNQVAVVLVTHDTREEVLGCLDGLGPAAAHEVVVVDCGSSDGTADAVRARAPWVRVLELDNAGFARGANAGVRATSTPVVVVANADVRMPPSAPQRLAEAVLRDPGVAAVGPAVVYPDGTPQASARVLPDLRTALGHALFGRVAPGNRATRRYRALDEDPTRPRDVDWLSGCTLALRREAFDAVGGFDPGYFLYVEDVDLGLRLAAAGWRLRYDPVVTVTHRVGASTSRHRARALIAHARGLDRFVGRHLLHGSWAPVARVAVRLGLGAWVCLTLVWERLAPASASTTGERRGVGARRSPEV